MRDSIPFRDICTERHVRTSTFSSVYIADMRLLYLDTVLINEDCVDASIIPQSELLFHVGEDAVQSQSAD